MLEVAKPFDVAALPIERIYRRKPALILWGIMLLILSPADVLAAWFSAKIHTPFNELSALAFFVSGGPIIAICYILWLGGSRLLIDDLGVHQRLGRKQHEYLWRDISGTKVIERAEGGGRGPRWKSQHLQIQTRDCPTPDPRANIISGIFGIRAADMEAIVIAGMRRWGGR
jgi:hypothetical protein